MELLLTPILLFLSKDPTLLSRLQLSPHFTILHATSILEGSDILSHTKLDAILLDDTVEQDALAHIASLRETLHKEHVPLFLCTGSLKKSYHETAKKVGVQGFLLPNFSEKEVFEAWQIFQKTQHSAHKMKNLSKRLPPS